jgi:hypothetical protein
MSRPLPKITSPDGALAELAQLEQYHQQVFEAFKETSDQHGQIEQHRHIRNCLAIRGYLEGLQIKQRGSGLELLPEDLEGLPAELIAELSISDSDQQEIDIMKLIELEGGTISLDLLLVRWFRAKKAVMKRKAMTSRLYRMQQKGRIFAVEGTKGIYSLHKQEEMPLDSPHEASSGAVGSELSS